MDNASCRDEETDCPPHIFEMDRVLRPGAVLASASEPPFSRGKPGVVP